MHPDLIKSLAREHVCDLTREAAQAGRLRLARRVRRTRHRALAF